MTAAPIQISHEIAPDPDGTWLSRKQAARFLACLGCPIVAGTLANMASNNNAGKGPPFTRYRWKGVRYRKSDLAAWADREAVRVE